VPAVNMPGAPSADLNGDGFVDVGDIMVIVNIMASSGTASTIPAGHAAGVSADLNGDGFVDVGDIMAIVNFMAGI